jgi:hypothetical protein
MARAKRSCGLLHSPPGAQAISPSRSPEQQSGHSQRGEDNSKNDNEFPRRARFIMFDNDYHNETDVNDAYTRILEITLNESDMTAHETWSWIAPKDYWSPYWEKADRLPNGDRIGTFGTQTKQYNSSIGAVLVEVNSTGGSG